MDNILAILHKKNIFIISGGIACLVLIAAVLISTLQSKQKSASQTQENSNNSILVTSPALTASENAIQKATIPNYGQWVSGSFAYNNINYPSTWQPETNNILSGGSTVTLLPSHLTNGDLLPRVHIEVSPLDPKNPISRNPGNRKPGKPSPATMA